MTGSQVGKMIALLLVLAASVAAQEIGSGTPRGLSAAQEIEHLLNAQVAAWNRGNLDGFMSGYLHSPDLTFFSNDSEYHGWQAALDRYKQRYQGEGRAMGQLNFEALRIETLGPDAAFVRGRWHLKMPDGAEPQGMFTLVLRRFPGEGWKIVHDHSSGK